MKKTLFLLFLLIASIVHAQETKKVIIDAERMREEFYNTTLDYVKELQP